MDVFQLLGEKKKKKGLLLPYANNLLSNLGFVSLLWSLRDWWTDAWRRRTAGLDAGRRAAECRLEGEVPVGMESVCGVGRKGESIGRGPRGTRDL